MRSTTKEICFAFCYLLAKGWFYATLFKLNVVMELRIKAYFVLSLCRTISFEVFNYYYVTISNCYICNSLKTHAIFYIFIQFPLQQ